MKSKKIEKSCEVCCQKFITQLRHKRYCSATCRNRSARNGSENTGGDAKQRAEKPGRTKIHQGSPAVELGFAVRKNQKALPRLCKRCGRKFQPSRQRPEAGLCSRKCQGHWVNSKGLGPRHNDHELLTRIVSVIQEQERCLSQEELCVKVGISHKVLLGREWTMKFLYEQAQRIYSGPELGSRFEDCVGEAIIDCLPGVEVSYDRKLPGMRGFKGGELRADFYIEDNTKGLKLIVEADGKQHLTGRGDWDKFNEIRANDRLKEKYAAANDIVLIRITQTADIRSIKAQLIRGIRRAYPRFRPLNPSNDRNRSESSLRLLRRRNTRGPRKKSGDRGEPLADVYCRGCHTRPSFKHRNSFLCGCCWERSRELGRMSRVLRKEMASVIKEEIVVYVKSKGRYVWHPEVYLNLHNFSIGDLKKYGIEVSKICRELGFRPPNDDRITRENEQRVKDVVRDFLETSRRPPKVTEVLKAAGMDHETLHDCMDYKNYIESIGGKITSKVSDRFPNAADFREAAVQVVKDAGRWLPMPTIVKKVGISYPSYLQYFKSVRSDEIHKRAGISTASPRR